MKKEKTKTRSLHELSEIFDEFLNEQYGDFKICGFYVSPATILGSMSMKDYVNVFVAWAGEKETEEYITSEEYHKIKDLEIMFEKYDEVMEKIRFELSAETIWGYDYDCIEILEKLYPNSYVSSLVDVAEDLFDRDEINEQQLKAFKTIIQFEL